MPQDKILLQLLKNAGLNEKESQVYLALLEIGQATVQEVADISGLKRPIIYVVLNEMIMKGFANLLPNKKINTYQAIDPGAISAQMQTSSKNFSEMLPVFKTLVNKGGKKPKISYFNTSAGIQRIYDEINRQKDAVFIASIARLDYYFPGSSSGWVKSYKTKFNRLSSRTIIPDHPQDIKIAKNFLKATNKVQIKKLPIFDECDMDIAVYGDKLAITTFENNPFLVVIESKAVPSFFLPIFEILWKSAKNIK